MGFPPLMALLKCPMFYFLKSVIWSSIFSGKFNEFVVMSVSNAGFLDNL